MIISLASINSEMKSSNFQITFQPGQVNGEVDCCKTVRFDSTGPLAESMYAFMIGTYEYVADDEGGDGGVRGIYRCTDCSYELELYYNPPGNPFAVSIFHNSAMSRALISSRVTRLSHLRKFRFESGRPRFGLASRGRCSSVYTQLSP